MPTPSAADLIDALDKSPLLNPGQRAQLGPLQGWCSDSRSLARMLVERGWVTSYQATQLLHGRCAQLVLGSYVLLDKLGEGGTSQIFKARHLTMRRTVALKILRPEMLADKEVAARFAREIEAISMFSHPNIVHAYDAGPEGSEFVLAMEYVEGADLARLVGTSGPLPVDQACDYIRQAALGLQYAHERGLIHRDIKPSNLFVTRQSTKGISKTSAPGSRWGQVKILDLGLARLRYSTVASPTHNLTLAAGKLVTQGTPEYMAPEQAIDLHSADIRADIYSLGCTFYFLLTGQPPFAGAPVAQILLKHQSAEPPSVEKLRLDVPPGVAKVLRKMLAKRPAERYQTPGEVAMSLPLTQSGSAFSTPATHRTVGTNRRRQYVGIAVSSAIVLALLLMIQVCRTSENHGMPDAKGVESTSPKQYLPKKPRETSLATMPDAKGVESTSPKQELPKKPRATSLALGQFVRIRHEGEGKVLSLAEVEVLQSGDGAPLHRKGKASQSSVGSGGVPERAIDGNVNQGFAGKSVTHTAPDDKAPWWMVDLGGIKDIGCIRIINRKDGLEWRLEGAVLEVLDKDRREVVYTANLKGVSKQEFGGK